MEKVLKTTSAICAGILCMLFLEAMLTLGAAFRFEDYTMFGWILQGIILLLAISFSAWLSIQDDK